ncbi:putative quinol monooxygenase [Paenibacillus sp. VCA1]|uniref:putative quinol monooxygenase n=1 Tax=Paenibacillus sp. VCA1 TaxID=3039148 RepID=UPI0028717688|nr:putative quinol monooxygenase [Paenibacillus sp. VCA1]MDR9855205.1 putative quinol monooxygenase [Paenibacillus sp. VCA1]
MNKSRFRGGKSMHYITACLKIISDKDLNEIMKEFKKLEEETNKEEGCIKFHAYPLEPSERKIMLWEIWGNEEAVKVHFTKTHTKNVQKQNLTEVEWLIKSNV